MEDRAVYIYGLTDTSNKVRYIGQSVAPWLRYDQHIVDNSDTPKTQWIRSMLTKGKKPGLVILDKTDKKNARYTEMWWITLGKRKGWKLTNSSRPTWQTPEFGDMFAQCLKDDFDQFLLEHQPIFLITKKHRDQATVYFRALLGVIVGLAMAWNVYYLEVSIGHNPPTAFFYAFTAFIFAGYSGFLWAIDEFNRLGGTKLIIMCASPLALVINNIAIWVMDWGTS